LQIKLYFVINILNDLNKLTIVLIANISEINFDAIDMENIPHGNHRFSLSWMNSRNK